MQFDFLKIGAPCRGERICKFQRLLSIFRDLQAAGQLAEPLSEEEFRQFPKLDPPPPPETTSNAQMDGADAKEAGAKKKWLIAPETSQNFSREMFFVQ